MKKILILLLVFIAFGVSLGLINRLRERSYDESSAKETQGPKFTEGSTGKHVTLEGKEYSYSYFRVNDISKLKLIPNFSEKLSSKDVLLGYDCKFMVSAGFYTNDDAPGSTSGGKNNPNIPIGLFIYDGNLVGNWTKNQLFDGVLSINDFGTPRITRSVPQDHLEIALQTGPILKENGKKIKLSIRNDKEERRVLAGITGENDLLFFIVFSDSNNFAGPYLSDLPLVLGNIEEGENIILADAVNLDGGTASSFTNGDLLLEELTIVGSFFCI